MPGQTAIPSGDCNPFSSQDSGPANIADIIQRKAQGKHCCLINGFLVGHKHIEAMNCRLSLLLFTFATGCAPFEAPPPSYFHGSQRMETFANGFKATLSDLPADTVDGRNWEDGRMEILRKLAWATGACTPEKNFRIVKRRVRWEPSDVGPQASPRDLMGTIDYVGICIRDRGCIPPPDPILRDHFAQRAMLERKEGRRYYEGCRWIEDEIRRIRREGALDPLPPQMLRVGR